MDIAGAFFSFSRLRGPTSSPVPQAARANSHFTRQSVKTRLRRYGREHWRLLRPSLERHRCAEARRRLEGLDAADDALAAPAGNGVEVDDGDGVERLQRERRRRLPDDREGDERAAR